MEIIDEEIKKKPGYNAYDAYSTGQYHANNVTHRRGFDHEVKYWVLYSYLWKNHRQLMEEYTKIEKDLIEKHLNHTID